MRWFERPSGKQDRQAFCKPHPGCVPGPFARRAKMRAGDRPMFKHCEIKKWIGAVGLLYGWKIDPLEGEKSSNLHFSIGYTF